jgi:hypothetical protein
MGVMIGCMDARTAGDVLRDELAGGTEKRALARRLAGDGADHTAIERWRAVLTRVQRGGEPKQEQARVVATRFRVKVRQPERRAAAKPADRLAALEAEVGELREGLELAGAAHDALLERVETLEAAAPRRGSAARGDASPRERKT